MIGVELLVGDNYVLKNLSYYEKRRLGSGVDEPHSKESFTSDLA